MIEELPNHTAQPTTSPPPPGNKPNGTSKLFRMDLRREKRDQ